MNHTHDNYNYTDNYQAQPTQYSQDGHQDNYNQAAPQPNYPQADQNMYGNTPGTLSAPQQVSSDYPGYAQAPSTVQSWFDYKNSSYLKGLLIGAGVTLLVTNPTVQKAVVKGAVKIWGGLQGSVEELKEQVEDIKAEMAEK